MSSSYDLYVVGVVTGREDRTPKYTNDENVDKKMSRKAFDLPSYTRIRSFFFP